MKPRLTSLGAVVVAGVLLAQSDPASAADPYPNRPITIIVPFGAGSGSDVTARFYAKSLTDALKATVVVENRPGANALIGAQAVAKAAPDGYTLLLGSGTANAVNYSLYADKIGYKPESFTTIGVIYVTPVVLFAPKATGAGTLPQLIAAGRDAQKGLSCGNGNAVTLVACAVLKVQSKTDVVSVPYKSNAQSLTDLAGGQLAIAFSDLAAGAPFINQGAVRPVAVASPSRIESLPDVPTFREQGLPEFEFTAWSALFAPAGTPEGVVGKLNATLRKMLATPEWEKQRATTAGLRVAGELVESRKFVAEEIARWAKYIQDTGVKGN